MLEAHANTKRILIVDDSADMLGLLKVVLESLGYKTDCRSNGQEAVDLLSSGESLPDMILLDMRMPVMNGHDFLKRLQEIPQWRKIPLFVMSGDEEPEVRQMQIMPRNVLRKPLNMELVREAVARNTALH